MKKLLICIALLAALFVIIAVSQGNKRPNYPAPVQTKFGEDSLGIVWEQVSDNPKPTPPICPEWYCLAIGDPWIGKNPDGGYVMYFTASGDRNIKEGFTIVGRAESADGNSWRVNPKDPVIVGDENSWDRSIETVDRPRWDLPHVLRRHS